jgi:glycerol-3-phosphate acyltransferase PlsY
MKGNTLQDFFVSFCISYLVGSIPTAFLVVKRTSNIDIRTVGSGNVGGRNALEVTGKKSIGVIVIAIDILKGVLAVALSFFIFPHNALAVSAAMAGSVFGHCYPIWLRFKGGRGLATTAGVFLLLYWVLIAIWLAEYFLASKIVKNVHLASTLALLGTPLAAAVMPQKFVMMFVPDFFSYENFLISSSVPILMCLSRHVQPLRELYGKKNH